MSEQVTLREADALELDNAWREWTASEEFRAQVDIRRVQTAIAGETYFKQALRTAFLTGAGAQAKIIRSRRQKSAMRSEKYVPGDHQK